MMVSQLASAICPVSAPTLILSPFASHEISELIQPINQLLFTKNKDIRLRSYSFFSFTSIDRMYLMQNS